MRFVGKVLIVIQVLLSVCFMAFAGAVFTVQTNWKDQSAALESQLEASQAEYDEMDEEFKTHKDDTEAKLETANQRADLAENTARGLQQRLDAMTVELDNTKTERDTQRELALNATDEAKIRFSEAVSRRVVNDKLHDKVQDLDAKVRGLMDDIFNRQIEKTKLVAKHSDLLKQVEAFQSQALKEGLTTDPKEIALKRTPPPIVVGEVLETRKGKRNSSELVAISIGSDDGLGREHRLAVYRVSQQDGTRSKFLGEIQIVYVETDRAVGVVVLSSKNGEIQAGDNVSTKL